LLNEGVGVLQKAAGAGTSLVFGYLGSAPPLLRFLISLGSAPSHGTDRYAHFGPRLT